MELDENDLRVDVLFHGPEQHVTIRHLPTGKVGRASSTSRILARRAAMEDLVLKLLRHSTSAV